jgi:hypothetical protein
LAPRIIRFGATDSGELVFIAIEAELDGRYGSRDGAACAEFSWEGFDDGSPTSARGWAAWRTAGRLVGHIFIHKGDDLGFVAERKWLLQQPASGRSAPHLLAAIRYLFPGLRDVFAEGG